MIAIEIAFLGASISRSRAVDWVIEVIAALAKGCSGGESQGWIAATQFDN